MKALVTQRTGTQPVMTVEERPIPVVREGSSLIRIHSATINQLSNTIRTGGFGDIPVPLVQGNEGAGLVEASDVFAKGTRVAIYGSGQLGISEDGLYQQWAVVENRRLMVLPDNISLDEGAALTVNYLTAYQALARIGKVKKGQYVLISGATGSVGNALVQTAKAIGTYPIALVSSQEKASHALKAGAHASIDWTTQNVVAEVKKLTGGSGADVAFDPVGGQLFPLLLNSLRQRGVFVSIGFTGGKEVSLNLLDIIVQEKEIKGYAVHADTPEQDREGLDMLSALSASGHLKPFIDARFDLNNVEKGYERLLSRQAIGSLLLNLE